MMTKAKEENRQLREILQDILEDVEPPEVVYIGWAHYKYEAMYDAKGDNPFKRARRYLTEASEKVKTNWGTLRVDV